MSVSTFFRRKEVDLERLSDAAAESTGWRPKLLRELVEERG